MSDYVICKTLQSSNAITVDKFMVIQIYQYLGQHIVYLQSSKQLLIDGNPYPTCYNTFDKRFQWAKTMWIAKFNYAQQQTSGSTTFQTMQIKNSVDNVSLKINYDYEWDPKTYKLALTSVMDNPTDFYFRFKFRDIYNFDWNSASGYTMFSQIQDYYIPDRDYIYMLAYEGDPKQQHRSPSAINTSNFIISVRGQYQPIPPPIPPEPSPSIITTGQYYIKESLTQRYLFETWLGTHPFNWIITIQSQQPSSFSLFNPVTSQYLDLDKDNVLVYNVNKALFKYAYISQNKFNIIKITQPKSLYMVGNQTGNTVYFSVNPGNSWTFENQVVPPQPDPDPQPDQLILQQGLYAIKSNHYKTYLAPAEDGSICLSTDVYKWHIYTYDANNTNFVIKTEIGQYFVTGPQQIVRLSTLPQSVFTLASQSIASNNKYGLFDSVKQNYISAKSPFVATTLKTLKYTQVWIFQQVQPNPPQPPQPQPIKTLQLQMIQNDHFFPMVKINQQQAGNKYQFSNCGPSIDINTGQTKRFSLGYKIKEKAKKQLVLQLKPLQQQLSKGLMGSLQHASAKGKRLVMDFFNGSKSKKTIDKGQKIAEGSVFDVAEEQIQEVPEQLLQFNSKKKKKI